ncbi:MAG TPA: glutamate--tRNA ligase [Actinobacteria bacterium]|nr:glutamate--tRNA ligase [Actinomycetota bacterium]
MTDAVRVRFCPSPTGDPHVGMLRTALFNWAYARHTGGTFVFRIEDTDAARDSEESYTALLHSLRWLGLDWDEGPEVGGDHGPYRQSERGLIYRDVISKLAEAGYTYPCFCTTEELAERREIARKEGRNSGYDGHCRELTPEQVEEYRAEGRTSVTRFRMPDQDWTWDDLVRGEVTFGSEHVPDFVLVRANGDPLYTLVNPTDDALMGITHVLRGEDLLSSTPRQLALHGALARLGIGTGQMPKFGHLPYVMGEGNKKLSKRDPEASFSHYEKAGFLPQGLANYLALLGWSPGNDVEFFSLAQMAEAFEISSVNANPARFDIKKCTSINGDWIRALDPDDLTARLVPYLIDAQVLPLPPTDDQLGVLRAAVPLISERMETLGQAAGMVGFLFADEPGCKPFELDPDDAAKLLDEQGTATLAAARSSLETLEGWTTEDIEFALRRALIDGLGLKPRLAFGPVRVAITGRRVSPPLFESMELLGRERSLRRLEVVAK